MVGEMAPGCVGRDMKPRHCHWLHMERLEWWVPGMRWCLLTFRVGYPHSANILWKNTQQSQPQRCATLVPSVSPFQVTLPNTLITIHIIQSFYLSRWKLESSIEKSYYPISHCSIIVMLFPQVAHIMSRRRGQRLQRTVPQNWGYSW